MALRWSELARDDLNRIDLYDKNRQKLYKVALHGDKAFIRKAARDLHDLVTGTPSSIPGTKRNNDEKRWYVIERGFIIVYRATRARVEILGVYHERELHSFSS